MTLLSLFRELGEGGRVGNGNGKDDGGDGDGNEGEDEEPGAVSGRSVVPRSQGSSPMSWTTSTHPIDATVLALSRPRHVLALRVTHRGRSRGRRGVKPLEQLLSLESTRDCKRFKAI